MNQFQQHHDQHDQIHEQQVRLPTSFICPLTMKIMDDPVMDQCAHNFERQAIVEWLSSTTTTVSATTTTTSCCPISNKPLSICDLIPNHTLAERIERWKWLREDSTIDYNYDENNNNQHHDIEEGDVQQEQQQQPRRQWFPHRKRQIHRSRRAVSKQNNTTKQQLKQQQLEYTSIPTGVPTTNAMITTTKNSNGKSNSSSSSINHPTTTIDLMLLPQERLALQKVQNENQMKQNEYNQKRMIRTLLIAMILCIILISCIVLYIRTIQQQQQQNNNNNDEEGVDVGEEAYDMNMTDDTN